MKYSLANWPQLLDVAAPMMISIPFDFGVEGQPMGELRYIFDNSGVSIELIQDNEVMSYSYETYEDVVDERTPE
jgi:hypothetical protein